MCAPRRHVRPSAQSPVTGVPADPAREERAPGSGMARRGFLATGLAGLSGLALAACAGSGSDSAAVGATGATDASGAATSGGAATGGAATQPGATPAQKPDAATIAQRATVPVLCYHQVRPWAGDDTSYNKEMLIIPPEKLAAQLDGMKDAGYTAISPQQYRDHLFTGVQLPAKPVILSFDDGKDNQISQALPALTQRGMTGTFFIMTVILGSKGWMQRDDVKRLADAGMTVASHTWDHHMVTKYTSKDYATQLEQPRELLRKLSGQPVDDFAYPYGAWNTAILPHIAQAGYQTAYQLQEQPIDPTHPELTLRRILAVSTWTGPQIVAKLDSFS